jgi:hypothetical protein
MDRAILSVAMGESLLPAKHHRISKAPRSLVVAENAFGHIDDTRTLPCCQLHDRREDLVQAETMRDETELLLKGQRSRGMLGHNRFELDRLSPIAQNDSAWTCPNYACDPWPRSSVVVAP